MFHIMYISAVYISAVFPISVPYTVCMSASCEADEEHDSGEAGRQKRFRVQGSGFRV